MSENNIISAIRYIARVLKAQSLDEAAPSLPDGISYREVYKLAKRHSLAGALWYMLEDTVKETGDRELVNAWSRERDVEFMQFFAQKQIGTIRATSKRSVTEIIIILFLLILPFLRFFVLFFIVYLFLLNIIFF